MLRATGDPLKWQRRSSCCALLYCTHALHETRREHNRVRVQHIISWVLVQCNESKAEQSEAKSRSGAAWQHRTHRQRVPLRELIWYYPRNYSTEERIVLYFTSYPRVWIVADALRTWRLIQYYYTIQKWQFWRGEARTRTVLQYSTLCGTA